VSVRVLERDSHVTPLGLRFRDTVTRETVSAGLVVTHPVARPPGFAPAVVTPGGLFAASGFPGLRAAELGVGDDAFWDDPPASGTYRIDVADTTGRFHGFSFEAELPARDLFELPCVQAHSPPLADGSIPLFSTPARTVPAGLAVLRADLWDVEADAPAAWAVIEATADGGPTAVGVSDARGSVAVILPYPEPTTLEASPPSARRSLVEQTWPLTLRVLYEPVSPVPDVPDLCEILGQEEATLVADDSPPTPLTNVTLEFGRELVVRSAGRPELLVLPAGSDL
jgi:hypothetical protein